MEFLMANRPTDPIDEHYNSPTLQVVTTRSGWFGTPSYRVAVKATHRPTGRCVVETSLSAWESPRSVRKRALARLETHD